MYETHALRADALGRLLGRAQTRAAMPYLAAGLLLVTAVLVFGYEIDRHVRAVESWIAGLGLWGALAFVLLFALGTSLFFPESVLSMSAGALFGLGWGFTIAVAGGLLAATLQYALARRLLRGRIQQALAHRPSLAAIQQAVLRDELRLQLLLRLTPLSPASVSYVLGAAGVRFSGFLAACLALTPHILAEVYFGHAGAHVARRIGGVAPASYLHDLVLAGGLAISVIVVAVVSRMARAAITRAVAAADPVEAGARTA